MSIADIAHIISQAGGRLYWVGGSVRDKLLLRKAKDLDFCVTGLSANQFEALFPHAFLSGQAFPVFRLNVENEVVEIALARTERKTGEGHLGFTVSASPDVQIEQDLKRRDLTMNAIAMDALTGQIVDPFAGQHDIRQRLIRAVSGTFAEDPLRVYRAARFHAQFEFEIESGTLNMMHSLKDELCTLSVERIFEELKKALRTNKPSLFFRALRACSVLDVHFSEIHALIGVEQPRKHHPEGDAFEHTMQVLDACAKLTTRNEVRFAALVHDVGKGVTPREKWPAHRGHESAGVSLVKQLCQRLKVPTTWTKAAHFATLHHMKIHIAHQMQPRKLVDLLTTAARNPLGVDGLSIIGLADVRGRNSPHAINQNAQYIVEMWSQIQTVHGRTIVTTATGKQFGEILQQERAKRVTEYKRNLHSP